MLFTIVHRFVIFVIRANSFWSLCKKKENPYIRCTSCTGTWLTWFMNSCYSGWCHSYCLALLYNTLRMFSQRLVLLVLLVYSLRSSLLYMQISRLPMPMCVMGLLKMSRRLNKSQRVGLLLCTCGFLWVFLAMTLSSGSSSSKNSEQLKVIHKLFLKWPKGRFSKKSKDSLAWACWAFLFIQNCTYGYYYHE